ncbi:hypothetical protein WMY93_003353 [Mugilogobius chulae]|uniref:Endonuclease/exonuclease/phosphatase domain-containing protein n=1 Tax=Mugilogobius chulae TaxID=88201 RepID=A0AAW0Q680_9GOBI
MTSFTINHHFNTHWYISNDPFAALSSGYSNSIYAHYFHSSNTFNFKSLLYLSKTLLHPGAATLLSRELCRYNITLAGLCEVRWQGSGEITAGDHCYIWSGPERRTGLYGVALAIPKVLRKSLISWTPLSDRLLSARFLHQHGKMTVIVAYAPTNVADGDVKDAFFDQLHQAANRAPPHDITIILTDANATLSSCDRLAGSPIGTIFADKSTNDNGNRLLLLCHHNNLCVADTWFPRKLIHHYTWYSPDGRTRKALDHILISRRWKSFVTNCRVYRGTELGNTDHRLLVAQLKLKLRANQHTKTQPRLDSSLLTDPYIASDFIRSIRRTLNALAPNKVTDWITFKESVIQSAHNVLGRSRPSPKKPWISEKTLDLINLRREARLRGDMPEYRRLNHLRNVAIAEDREKFWETEAEHLESAANNNNMSRVFSLLRQARNSPRIKTALVKDSDGHLLTTEATCLERWKEHFSLLLQQGSTSADPTTLAGANVAPASNICNTDPVTPEEEGPRHLCHNR